MKVKQLPKGPLYWRVENFPTLDQAKAAAGEYRWNPDTVANEGWPSLTAEVAGKVWLFTLGPQGAAAGGPDDRIVTNVDANSFTTVWVDPDNASRYGTSVYVRCGKR